MNYAVSCDFVLSHLTPVGYRSKNMMGALINEGKILMLFIYRHNNNEFDGVFIAT